MSVSPGHVQPLYAGERGGRGHPAGRHQRGTGARTGLRLHGTGEPLTHAYIYMHTLYTHTIYTRTHTRTYIHTYTITQIKVHRLTQIKLHRLTNPNCTVTRAVHGRYQAQQQQHCTGSGNIICPFGRRKVFPEMYHDAVQQQYSVTNKLL